MKNDPWLPPILVPILPCPQRSPTCKPKPLHSDLAINPEQLLLFSLYSEASEETPKDSKQPWMGQLRRPTSLQT